MSTTIQDPSPKSFDKCIRTSFRNLKNRHFKNISIQKKKMKNDEANIPKTSQ